MAHNEYPIQKLTYLFLSNKKSLTLYHKKGMPIQMKRGEDNLFHSDYYFKNLSVATLLLLNAITSHDLERIDYLLKYQIEHIDFNTKLLDKPHLIFSFIDLYLSLDSVDEQNKVLEFLKQLYTYPKAQKLFLIEDTHHTSPFIYAFRENNIKLIEFFLENNLFSSTDHALSRLFMRTDLKGEELKTINSVYQLLRRYGVDPSALGLDGQTLFYHAASSDSADHHGQYGHKLRFLLSEGINPHQKNEKGEHVIEALAQTQYMIAPSNFFFLSDMVKDTSILQNALDKIQSNNVFISRPDALKELSERLSIQISNIEKKSINQALDELNLPTSNKSVGHKIHKI